MRKQPVTDAEIYLGVLLDDFTGYGTQVPYHMVGRQRGSERAERL